MSRKKRIILAVVFLAYLAAVWLAAWFLATGTAFIAIGVVMSACGATILGVYVLVSKLGSPAAAEPAAKAPAAATGPGGNGLSSKPFQDLVLEADRRMAKSPKFAGGRRAASVSGMPLYLVAGAENAGKTSLLRGANIGLEMLSGQTDVDDRVTKTPVGNLWLADGALFAEAGGGVFAHDHDWLEWLNALSRRHAGHAVQLLSSRSERNQLQGLLLLCDAGEFLGAPDASRQSANIRLVQERLRAAGEVFRCSFPVYVIFTKADRVPFFQDYFGRLRSTEDEQPLGCTLERTPKDPASAQAYQTLQTRELEQAFHALYLSLTDNRLLFLSREDDPARKPGIYEFPREVKRIRGNLIQFLIEAFRPSPLQPGPVLRGFYFTGVRQVAENKEASSSSADRTHTSFSGEATRLLRTEDLQPQLIRPPSPPRTTGERSSSRYAFVTGLLRDVVLADSQAVPESRSTRQYTPFDRLAVAAAVALCALFTVGAIASWLNNRGLLADVRGVIGVPARSQRDAGVSPEAILRLDSLRAQVETVESDSSHTPVRLDLFLYSGDTVLSPLQSLYFTRFKEYLLSDVYEALNQRLSTLPSETAPSLSYDSVYSQLKAYLTITSRDCKPERPFLPGLLNTVWGEQHAGMVNDDSVKRAIFNQFDFYARHLNSPPREVALEMQKSPVGSGRAYLNRFGDDERLYSQIIDAENLRNQSVARLDEYAPNWSKVLNASPDQVPSAYTRSGWDDVLREIQHAQSSSLGATCVTGGNPLSAATADSELSDKLRGMYASKYARRWRDFLLTVHLRSFGNADDAASRLNALDDRNSPLLGALNMVHDNTGVKLPGDSGVRQKLESLAPSGRFSKILGASRQAVEKELPAAPKANVNFIIQIFQPVGTLFDVNASRANWFGDKNSPYLDALSAMAKAMNELSRSSSPTADVALNQAAAAAHDKGVELVRNLAYRFDNADVLDNATHDIADHLDMLLKAPFLETEHLYNSDPTKGLVLKTNGLLSQLCHGLNPLLTKFPFRKTGEDASLQEFTSVFEPNSGALATFARSIANLAAPGPEGFWQPAPTVPPELQIDPEFLHSMNTLSTISDIFFAKNSVEPGIKLHVEPVLDSAAQSAKLDLYGHSFTGSGWDVSMPGTVEGVQLHVTSGLSSSLCGSQEGHWALFRFLQTAESKGPAGADFDFGCFSRGDGGRSEPSLYDGKPVHVRLKLTPKVAAARQALDPAFWREVRCPARIVSKR